MNCATLLDGLTIPSLLPLKTEETVLRKVGHVLQDKVGAVPCLILHPGNSQGNPAQGPQAHTPGRTKKCAPKMAWRHRPIILATQEAEARGLKTQSLPGQLSETTVSKHKTKIWAYVV